jgi:hypothetical protein
MTDSKRYILSSLLGMVLMNLVYGSQAVINGILKTNIVIVQSCFIPFHSVLSHLFSLKWQSRSCLIWFIGNHFLVMN